MQLFLHVNIRMKAENKGLFAQRLGSFLNAADSILTQQFKWSLEGGLLMEKPTLIPEKAKAWTLEKDLASTEVQFVNVWRLPPTFSSGDVGDIMLKLSESKEYVGLDSLVTVEAQELVYRFTAPLKCPASESMFKKVKGGPGKVVRIRRYVDRKFLGDFVFNGASLIPFWESDREWTFLGTFQNITGLLNEFWDFWYVPDFTDVEKFGAELATITNATDSVSAAFRKSIGYVPVGTTPGPDETNSPHDGLSIMNFAQYFV
jgi:hypothetical protein